MQRILALFTYTPEALAGLLREPQDRSAAVREWTEARGGKLVALYHTLGEYHVVVITEEPDGLAAVAGDWTAEAAGHIKTFKSMPLFTAEETMEALRNADDIALRPPGQ
jgi:uncharacterized protein with GYD domain